MIKNLDVVLCTYNSNKPYFEKCLRSIKREIPLHRLIVVDKFSTDGTIGVVKKHFPDSIVIQTEVSLAEARKIGISNVDTEYFVFVDDDIELYTGWFSIITRSINPKFEGEKRALKIKMELSMLLSLKKLKGVA